MLCWERCPSPARICLSRVDLAGRWDTFRVRKRTGWDRGLKVEASGKGLIGHAGAVLLHRAADRSGLVVRLRRCAPLCGCWIERMRWWASWSESRSARATRGRPSCSLGITAC